MARAAGTAQQDQLAADRVDRQVHVAVVVEVRRGQPAPVRPRQPIEPDQGRHVRELAVDVLQHLHRPGVAGQVRDRDRPVREHEVEVPVVVEVDP